jgi:phosphatidate cytidylyltransferase
MLIFKSKSEFWSRLFISTIAITLVALLVGFAYHPWIHFLLPLTIAGLTAVGVWEYAKLAQAKGIQPSKTLMIIVAIIEVLAFYAVLVYPEWSRIALPIIVFGFISFFVAHFKKSQNALLNVAVEFFGVCYLAIPFSFMLAILYPPEGKGDGRFWLFYLIAVTKVTDIGGYFIGKIFGKHPLAPQLSPKKTVEGAIGGFCFSVGLSLFFAYISSSMGSSLSYFNAAWLGIFVSILAQVGDLAESVLKRDALVKDSNTIPGVGGILDMVDSVLLTAPVVYFFIRSI